MGSRRSSFMAFSCPGSLVWPGRGSREEQSAAFWPAPVSAAVHPGSVLGGDVGRQMRGSAIGALLLRGQRLLRGHDLPLDLDDDLVDRRIHVFAGLVRVKMVVARVNIH